MAQYLYVVTYKDRGEVLANAVYDTLAAAKRACNDWYENQERGWNPLHRFVWTNEARLWKASGEHTEYTIRKVILNHPAIKPNR